MFIFAPVKTMTFDNEKAAMDLAKKIKDTLDHVNARELELGAAGLASLIWLEDTEGL